jgi:hypothetical protein
MEKPQLQGSSAGLAIPLSRDFSIGTDYSSEVAIVPSTDAYGLDRSNDDSASTGRNSVLLVD